MIEVLYKVVSQWLLQPRNLRPPRLVFAIYGQGPVPLACENTRFSSLFAAGDVPRETSPAAKSEEKRMFSHATVPRKMVKGLSLTQD